ncbi:flagellar biosynthetic protein FliO [Acidisphaera sp. L21]|jgi:flagellar protein FliO/FliZ|uniref:flagellar biosynthetic protein FliO n=1 Tax=Acidisphaera sp. L21 TaxID=1641851 RepID=UPI00131DA2E8|nr:flagellar biosynthetic protein FliO [Acidisphaera sp. L21]
MNTTSIFTAVAALAAVLLLILVAGRLARMTKFVRPRGIGAPRMSIQDALVLDPRRRLLMIDCDGRSLLLLTGPQDQVVGWLPPQAEPMA